MDRFFFYLRPFHLVLALYVLLAFGYSVLMPPWEAPDETAHYLVALHLARQGKAPTVEETYEAAQPLPYYWLSAQVLRLLDRIDPELVTPYRPSLTTGHPFTRYHWTVDTYRRPLWGMQILRWLNIPLGAIALWFIYKGARRFTAPSLAPVASEHFPQAIVPAATTALVGLMPQFLHNAASVSNDPLANAAGALLFWLLSLVSTLRLSMRQIALISTAALLAPLLIKLTILPMSLVLLFFVYRQAKNIYPQKRLWFAVNGMLPALAIVAVLLWSVPESATFVWRNIYWRLTYVRPDAFSSWSFWRITTFYSTSYWGQVGWKSAGLPGVIVALLMSLALLGWLTSLRLLVSQWHISRFWRWLLSFLCLIIAGWLVLYRADTWWEVPWSIWGCFLSVVLLAWWRYHRSDPARQIELDIWGWRAVWWAALLTLVILFKNYLTTPQYQGRFFFPSLGSLSLLMVVGWYVLIPRRAASYLPYLVAVAMVGLNLLLWYTRVLPVFYQPFIDG